MNRDLFGNAHPATAEVMINLAFLAYDASDLDTAISSCQEALQIQRDALGQEHPEVAVTMSTCGRWLSENGDAKAAEPLLREALGMNLRLLDADHPDVALVQLGLAQLLSDRGDHIEALALAQPAALSLADAYGESHWITAHANSIEGGVLAGLGDYARAEPLLRNSFEALNNDDAARPVYVAAARQRLEDMLASKRQAGSL